MRRLYPKNELDILKKEDDIKDEHHFPPLGIPPKGNMRVFSDNSIFDSFPYIHNVSFHGE